MARRSRVQQVIDHCQERIKECRRVEAKFGSRIAARRDGPLPQALMEAVAERQALTQVLAILNIRDLTSATESDDHG